MDKMQLISLINEWQNEIANTSGIHRTYIDEIFSEMGSKPIKIVTGFRRSGKSFCVQQVARQCIDTSTISRENILYLNFEDFRLLDITTPKALYDVVTTFETHIAQGERQLIILDEIQNVEQWDRVVRTLYEKKKKTDFIITGSNSSLLSSELGSHLSGRYIEFFILPFNFCEYLAYHDVHIKTETEFYKSIAQVEKHFSNFVQFGGLPETFDIVNYKAKYSYLEGIVSKIILDDIVRRYNIRQVAILENVFHYLMNNNANIVSYKKITNLIRNQDVTLKGDTVSTYIDYLESAFALFPTSKFDWKADKVFSTSKKCISIDTGIVNLYDSVVNQYPSLLENIVYLHLKRAGGPIYYGALPNGREIDFIVKSQNREFCKYQVCTNLTKENEERELGSFCIAHKHQGPKGNYILTMDQSEDTVINYSGTDVTKIYIPKWLLFD